MAHQAHSLPWNSLSEIFEYTYCDERNDGRTDFKPQMRSQQGKTIEHFARVFHKTIMDHTTSKQIALEAEFESKPHSNRLINEEEQKQVQKMINYAWNQPPGKQVLQRNWHPPYNSCSCCCSLHDHDDSHEITHAKCDLTLDLYDFEAWVAIFECTLCCQYYGYAQISLLIKVFLINNHLEPLFRVTRHREMKLEELYYWPWMSGGTAGWLQVVRSFLNAYLALNIIYTKPEIWPSQSNDATKDYRLTAMYEKLLHICTETTLHGIHTLPHRFFFGRPRGGLYSPRETESKPRRPAKLLRTQGNRQVNELLEEDMGYITTKRSISEVASILRTFLPQELVDHIMELASLKTPMSRLTVPDDPLHPDNSEELARYLGYCWKILTSCGLLARWLGKEINWDEEVRGCISTMFFSDGKYQKMIWYDHTPIPGNWMNVYHGQGIRFVPRDEGV